MKMIFLKDSYYNSKKIKEGQIVEMAQNDLFEYVNCGVVKQYIPPNKIKIKNLNKEDLEKKSYKELQEMCKKRNIKAVGLKQDLIFALIENNKN